ncbi:E3 ubiquitin-protein ligase TRIM11 [Nematolebias whitei]|uniref:E3 ubiquitin-protein ligase TRIM11 n=1 Tax=Nematolebias whitei TaxID=451745 RepID=UPI001899C8BF|nr:E3 ubiquitin-protein ligase TRIM11 [Nematolebias whitei]
MAQASISVTESQFRCPICLDILRDPVSTPCGHTYCMECINNYWDQAEPPGHHSCPQCREPLCPRPVLRRNTVLAEVVDKLRLREGVGQQLHLGGCGEVPCEEESRVHAQEARRQLQLQESQRILQGRIRTGERDLEELQQTLDSLKVSACAVLEDSEALFADMAQRLEKTKAEVRVMLEAKERVVVGRAAADIELLEKDLEELRRRDEEISQLLKTEDSTRFLQAAPLLCIRLTSDQHSRTFRPPTEAFSDARKALCHLRSRLEDVCREEVDRMGQALLCVKGGQTMENAKPQQPLVQHNSRAVPVSFHLSTLSLQPPDQRMRATLLRFSCHLSLDPVTAYPTLVLLEGPQGAHCGEEAQPYPPHPHRFDSVSQVLCREGQFEGTRYWEVEWRGGGWIDIGVTSLSIGRKGGGRPCLLGRNENSWRLRCTHVGYSAWHDNLKTTVAAPPCPRIGVLLEREKGTLSYYSVSDTMVLLHTFNCQYSQPLYPAFRLDLDSTLLICPPEGGNRT